MAGIEMGECLAVVYFNVMGNSHLCQQKVWAQWFDQGNGGVLNKVVRLSGVSGSSGLQSSPQLFLQGAWMMKSRANIDNQVQL